MQISKMTTAQSDAYKAYCAGAYLPYQDWLTLKLEAIRRTLPAKIAAQPYPNYNNLSPFERMMYVSGAPTAHDHSASDCLNIASGRRWQQLRERRDALRAVFESASSYDPAIC